MVKLFKNAWLLVKESGKEWPADRAPRLGAALSYYTVFSIAPVLLLVISVLGLFLGREAAQGQIFHELSGVLGPDAAAAVQTAIAKSAGHKGGVLATVIGALTVLLGATGVMIELQGALNQVWKVIPKPGLGVLGFIRQRLLSLALVLSFGFVLLVSLVLSAGLSAMGNWFTSIMPGWVVLGQLLNWVVSIGLITLLMGLIFKALPQARLHWRDVWIGAFVTAVLFQIGKYLIGLYIARASVASTFGAAGSLAVLLVWVYYSSQIILFGAEFTRAYANHFGSRLVPDDNAVAAPSGLPERDAAERIIKGQGTSPHPGTRPSPA
jgi:membrane protein